MYLYSLTGFEEKNVLFHKNKYTTEEFHKMCKEAPLEELSRTRKYYSSENISKYLINKYGFKKVKYEAGFFIDNYVE